MSPLKVWALWPWLSSAAEEKREAVVCEFSRIWPWPHSPFLDWELNIRHRAGKERVVRVLFGQRAGTCSVSTMDSKHSLTKPHGKFRVPCLSTYLLLFHNRAQWLSWEHWPCFHMWPTGLGSAVIYFPLRTFSFSDSLHLPVLELLLDNSFIFKE